MWATFGPMLYRKLWSKNAQQWINKLNCSWQGGTTKIVGGLQSCPKCTNFMKGINSYCNGKHWSCGWTDPSRSTHLENIALYNISGTNNSILYKFLTIVQKLTQFYSQIIRPPCFYISLWHRSWLKKLESKNIQALDLSRSFISSKVPQITSKQIVRKSFLQKNEFSQAGSNK